MRQPKTTYESFRYYETSYLTPDIELRSATRRSLHYAALLDTSFLTSELAEVVESGTANLTVLIDGDRVDERGLNGEDTLNTDIVAHFANSEALLVAFT